MSNKERFKVSLSRLGGGSDRCTRQGGSGLVFGGASSVGLYDHLAKIVLFVAVELSETLRTRSSR